MVYAKPQAGSVHNSSKFSKKNQNIYLFPGTLHSDNTAVGFNPSAKIFCVYDIREVNPVKKVPAHKNKVYELDKEIQHMAEMMKQLEDYTGSLDNKYYRTILLKYVQSMTKKELVSREVQNATLAVINQLRRSHPDPVLEGLEELAKGYYDSCRVRESLSRRDDTITDFIAAADNPIPVTKDWLNEVRNRFYKQCEKMNVDKTLISSLVRAKVVAQAMLISELIDDRHMFVFDEVVGAITKYRADIAEIAPMEKIIKHVQTGLKRLTDDELLEYNSLLKTYTLTNRCRSLMIQLMEIDNSMGLP